MKLLRIEARRLPVPWIGRSLALDSTVPVVPAIARFLRYGFLLFWVPAANQQDLNDLKRLQDALPHSR